MQHCTTSHWCWNDVLCLLGRLKKFWSKSFVRFWLWIHLFLSFLLFLWFWFAIYTRTIFLPSLEEDNFANLSLSRVVLSLSLASFLISDIFKSLWCILAKKFTLKKKFSVLIACLFFISYIRYLLLPVIIRYYCIYIYSSLYFLSVILIFF